MKVTARLDEANVREILGDLLPVTLALDEDGGGARWIRIDPARAIDFVADDGLRVEVGGHLQWKTAGVPLPLTIKSAHLLLRPAVAEDEDGGHLVFHPSLETMDLKNIPGFLDSGIANLINKRLAGEGDRLSWRFARTLRASVPIGQGLAEIASFELSAGSGGVQITNDALLFTVDLGMRFTRTAPPPAPDTP
ncbi:MAG: hypothetical protein ABI560_02700 [Myxococcales bacterium]